MRKTSRQVNGPGRAWRTLMSAPRPGRSVVHRAHAVETLHEPVELLSLLLSLYRCVRPIRRPPVSDDPHHGDALLHHLDAQTATVVELGHQADHRVDELSSVERGRGSRVGEPAELLQTFLGDRDATDSDLDGCRAGLVGLLGHFTS